MIRGLLNATLTALVVFTASPLIDAYQFFNCPAHQNTLSNQPQIHDPGFAFARPTDRIFACQIPHCFDLNPIPNSTFCHTDRTCLCAAKDHFPTPQSVTDYLIKQRGPQVTCTLDQENPRRGNTTGQCPDAHCARHLGL